jgi:hypothetical protein
MNSAVEFVSHNTTGNTRKIRLGQKRILSQIEIGAEAFYVSNLQAWYSTHQLD